MTMLDDDRLASLFARAGAAFEVPVTGPDDILARAVGRPPTAADRDTPDDDADDADDADSCDGGPVVLQSRVAVQAGESAALLAARVLASEHVIYPKALAWFAQRRLTWHDDAAWLDGAPLRQPLIEDFRDAR